MDKPVLIRWVETGIHDVMLPLAQVTFVDPDANGGLMIRIGDVQYFTRDTDTKDRFLAEWRVA